MAYKTIIVDDNQNTVRSLQMSVPWQEHGFELVGTAFDGTQGCKLIEEQHPDIVITDIRMPDTDGLTLIEREQELLQDSRVILITGYDKFQYAAQAIRLSVFDYILKPIDDNELLESLLRAKTSLDHDRNDSAHRLQVEQARRRAQMISLLKLRCPSDTTGIFPDFCSADLSAYCFIVINSVNGISQPALQRLSFVIFPDNLEVVSAMWEDTLVLFCGFLNSDPDWKGTVGTLAHSLTNHISEMTCVVSNLSTDLMQFQLVFQEALQKLLQKNVMECYTGITFCHAPEKENGQPHVTDMHTLCRKLVEEEPPAVWKVILETSKGQIRQLRIMLMLYSTQVLQKKFANGNVADAIDTAVYDVPYLNSVQSAQRWFEQFISELDRATQNEDTISDMVRNVLCYINAHATDGLSLENVAKHFYVSPHYLSGLIRKETGITYQQHVIQAKMDVAKKMLNDTRMRVEDIAYAIGYENYISFYNIFKRIENKTPTEYRFRNRSRNAV